MSSIFNPGGGGASPAAAICTGRLTLTSGTPVTRADVTGATSAYWTPYGGNQIGLYDGAAWNLRTFPELAISLAGLTALGLYDLFAYDNSGTPAIDPPVAWASGSARATALAVLDGVLVKSGALTRRYLGTIGINASGGQSNDTFAERLVSNFYNPKRRGLRVVEATASWAYTLATWRQVRASAANQVVVVVGVEGPLLELVARHQAYNATVGVSFGTGIGEDSTSVVAPNTILQVATPPTTSQPYLPATAALHAHPTIGRHVYAWLEYSNPAGTTNWVGTEASALKQQTGLSGWIDG